MARKPNKLSGISQYFDTRERVQNNPEVKVREAFLRATRNTLDNFGVDRYSVERIWGMLEVLEQYAEINNELER